MKNPWTGLEEPIRKWPTTVACSACDVTADSAAKAKQVKWLSALPNTGAAL